MRRARILFYAFVLLQASLCAQTTIGVEGGLSENVYHTVIANRAATSLSPVTGYAIDASCRYRVDSWLYLLLLPGIVQKSYSMDRTDSLYGEYHRQVNTYLQLPVGVSLAHDWGRLRATVDAGSYAAYWLSGRVSGKVADLFSVSDNAGSESFQLKDYSAPYTFLSKRDRRWELGWFLGLGGAYRLGRRYSLTTAVRYLSSLTSQETAEDNSFPACNRTWTFTFGGSWDL